jgi:hypothetical protein
MASQMGAADLPRASAPNEEHQVDLIRSAVALLAAGGARRVTLIALTLDSQSLSEVGSLVRSNGMAMRVVPGHIGCDITVEAIG